jgi:hypothetical protein
MYDSPNSIGSSQLKNETNDKRNSLLNLDILEFSSRTNVHLCRGRSAMNQTNDITMKNPLNNPKVKPSDRFIN